MGSGFGYSAYWMAKALREPDAFIICTDGSQENAEQAAAYLARGGIAERIDYRVGNALEIIFLLFARRSANILGLRRYLVVKPKSTLSFSWFLIESRKRHRLFRVTQREFAVYKQPIYPFALRQDKKPSARRFHASGAAGCLSRTTCCGWDASSRTFPK